MATYEWSAHACGTVKYCATGKSCVKRCGKLQSYLPAIQGQSEAALHLFHSLHGAAVAAGIARLRTEEEAKCDFSDFSTVWASGLSREVLWAVWRLGLLRKIIEKNYFAKKKKKKKKNK